MKLIIAIVQDEDASKVASTLMENGFSVTKLATTGGFLRAGNTTLLLGVNDDKIETVMGLIEKVCKSRKQVVSASTTTTVPGTPGVYSPFPVEVVVGGATIFIMNVDQFVRI